MGASRLWTFLGSGKAAQAFMGHESSMRWWHMYQDRSNPEFIVCIDEASLLDLFRKQVGLHMEVALCWFKSTQSN